MFVISILALGQLDRACRISRMLKMENNFQCAEEDARKIALLCVFTELTDRQIGENVLKAHSFEQLKAT